MELLMALTYSDGMPLNTKAPDFSLPGTDGSEYSLDSFREAKALVVVFTCNHCPYAIAAEDRLIDIQNRYMARGVQIVAINPNNAARHPEDSYENMKRRHKDKGFPFPYLYDETQEVARAYEATCTPDLFVFNSERLLKYNGRIDDNWKHPERATSHDLVNALEAILDGSEIDFEAVPSMGCSIKWKQTDIRTTSWN